MAPKKEGNSKKEAGRARKAETEQKKKDAVTAEKERKEAAEWEAGAKSSKGKDDKEAKRAADAARKAENARLLAEEEASAPSKPKAAPKAGAKKAAAPKAPAGPGALAAGGLQLPEKKEEGKEDKEMEEVVETFAATGLDDALDLLTAINAKKDKASIGTAAGQLEKHPERRFKAAFKEYEERMLPKLREERPGLRLQQYKDLIFKQFQKAPENPFNQAAVEYNATKEERIEVLNKQRRHVEDRLRVDD
ncbi:DUF1014-domain-containing protein [Dacryopinax primogenitus]|uniref:DUF1014-domain-containing protein n=1 Tax=Dacryopinax primogenitus (strain DJM 731) TaxID=1858805 RepID=M5GF15_DACPD|nr:DUF1014-domain-containing protein [Dacryopinax primogenitus]EJU05892.1 DUF1014-domain-containing protein [Dacryopinax primogenitus]